MNGTLELYGDLFAELSRLQHGLDNALRPGSGSSIRGFTRRTFPVINIGTTADAIEVMALAPGVEPDQLQVTVEKGLLIISGERKQQSQVVSEKTAVHAQERFHGMFRRVISLPEDADPANIRANCRDGLLRVTVARREAAKPRHIAVNG
jgi:HSP20 family protein